MTNCGGRTLLLALMCQRSLDKPFEQRVRLIWFALKFGVILASQKIGVIAQLDQLGERAIGRSAGNFEAFLAHSVAIFHVELITMSMALEHFVAPINLLRESTMLNFCRPGSEPHTGALVPDLALFFEQTDHRIGRGLIELAAVGVFDSTNVASKLNCRHLHAETKPEIGQLVFPCKTRGFNFSFYPAVAKAAGNEHTGYIFELATHSILEPLRIDQFQIDPTILAGGGMS